MDIQVTASPELTVTWTNEPTFRVVTCALFRCAPVLEQCTDGHARITAESFARCVISSQVVEPPEAAAELSSGPITSCTSASGEDLDSPLVHPMVACWAYNTTSLVRVSHLVRLLPQDPPFDLTPGCSAQNFRDCLCEDGTLCSCHEGECVPRCLSDADCPAGVGHCTYSSHGSGTCDVVGVCAAAGAP